MKLTTTSALKLREVFAECDRLEVEYVIPHGYDDLPDLVPGGDVDVIIRPDHIQRAVEICRSNGFRRVWPVRRWGPMSKKALRNPKRVFKVLRTAIGGIVGRSSGGIGGAAFAEMDSYVRQLILRAGDAQIHVLTHCAYKSPHNEMLVRVDPRVEASLFEHRQHIGAGFVPDAPNELLHLVCRGVYDKHGVFPHYYLERLEHLRNVVAASKEQTTRLNDLTELVFFQAAKVVLAAVDQGRYHALKRELLSFADY